MPGLADDLGPYGAALPQLPAETFRAERLRGVARQAEELGLGALWVSDMGGAPVVDPLVALAHAAAITERVRLAVSVLVAGLRTPVHLAADLASIDVLSGGRLVVGLGLGGNPAAYARHGLSPDQPLRRYLDTIELVSHLWSEDELSWSNEWWQLDGPTNVLAPQQRPRPPLLLGGKAERAVARAAEIADGWCAAGSVSIAEALEGLAIVRKRLEELERDRSSFVTVKRVYLAVDADRERSLQRLREWFSIAYGKPDLAERVAVTGDAGECAEQLRALRDAGFDHLTLNPVFDEREQIEQLVPLLSA
jgi:alkanesulfonate monooxygenase SsuD/methylene tetrahydromethanopterin reductase-like flavin-dependent oxidoreductase (luciferase family)